MRLYHSPGSRSTRVLWTLEEIGAPYDVTILTREERRGEEHRRRHPLGRVPALELDDGRILLESAAICLHLGDLYPESGIVPAIGSPQRPFVYQWTFFAMAELEPTLIGWARLLGEERDGTESQERFAEQAAMLEAVLRDGPWLLGESFSVADVICSKILNLAFSRDPSDRFAELRAYTERALARPANLRAEAVGRD
jgi:glutathione S-transferase